MSVTAVYVVEVQGISAGLLRPTQAASTNGSGNKIIINIMLTKASKEPRIKVPNVSRNSPGKIPREKWSKFFRENNLAKNCSGLAEREPNLPHVPQRSGCQTCQPQTRSLCVTATSFFLILFSHFS